MPLKQCRLFHFDFFLNVAKIIEVFRTINLSSVIIEKIKSKKMLVMVIMLFLTQEEV